VRALKSALNFERRGGGWRGGLGGHSKNPKNPKNPISFEGVFGGFFERRGGGWRGGRA